MHNPSHADSTVEITSVRFRPTMKALTPIFLYLGVFLLVFAAIALLTYEPYSEMVSKTPSGTFTVAKMNPPPDPAILLNAPVFVAVGVVAAAVAIAMYNLVAGRFGGVVVRTAGSPAEEKGVVIREVGVCAAGGIGGVIFFGLGACTCLLYMGLGWLSSIWWPHSGAIYGSNATEMIITALWIISQVAVGFVIFGGGALLYNLFLPWTRGAVVTVREIEITGDAGDEDHNGMYAVRAFATPTVARAAAAIGFGWGCLLVATTLIGAIADIPFLPALPQTETFVFDLLVCPFIYAGGAFLIGAIASVIYNATARVLRGFVFRTEREEKTGI